MFMRQWPTSHRYAKFSKNTGLTYEGMWKEDKPHGKGVQKLEDGSVYEGDFIDGAKEGYGVYTWADGRKYKGPWLNGK